MEHHITKAQNNERFLLFIEESIKDDFIDWKITVIFYAALHYIKAFLKKNKIIIGQSHSEIESAIKAGGKFPLPPDIYDIYHDLYRTSREARYVAIYTTPFQDTLLQFKCNEAKEELNTLKEFIKTCGLKIK